MKISTDHEGNVVYFCQACNLEVSVDSSYGFNNNLVSPTLEKPIVIEWEDELGNLFICRATIRDGRITYSPQDTHALKGRTIDLPDLPR